MNMLLVVITLFVAVLTGAGLHRVWRGPTVFDRLVAVAALTVNTVILLVLLGYASGRASFFLDIAIAYALLAFVFPIVLGRFVERRGLSDEEETGW